MAVFYVTATTYAVLSEAETERFLALEGKPGLRGALKA
jgi:hypothetical protein